MALGIALSQAVRSVLQFTRNFSSELYGQRIERDARQELYQDLLGKSMTFHDRQPLGELLARVTNDVRELNLMMNPGINLIVGSGIFLVMPAIYSAFLHPLLTIVPVLFIVSYVYAQIRYVRALRGTARRVRSSFGQLNSHLAESLEGIEVVKGNSQERREYERFEQNVAAVYQRNVEQADLEAVYIPFLLLGVATVSGLAHVTYLVIHDVVPISAVVTYMGYFALFGSRSLYPNFLSPSLP
ncbi:MAG UNVERIFIED_CONTAM: ABC transporter ATP-binding protein [Anaerolineae bacterium]|jgi:ATP-binding cassette subfamily B protein